MMRTTMQIARTIWNKLPNPIKNAIKDLVFGRFLSRRSAFEKVYRAYQETGYVWGSVESASGSGSELSNTEAIRRELPLLVQLHDVRVIVDAPCGDWNWMSHVSLPVSEYIGIDIVAALVKSNQQRFERDGVSFLTLDIVTDAIPVADLIMCRDCLVHLSLKDAIYVLRNFARSRSTLLLTNTYPKVLRNADQYSGHKWRQLNLRLPPFNFPDPIYAFTEEDKPGRYKTMALWRLSDLPLGS